MAMLRRAKMTAVIPLHSKCGKCNDPARYADSLVERGG